MAVLRRIGKMMIPRAARGRLREAWLVLSGKAGPFGNLRRVHPVRRDFGHKHGKCIDRYYIESFLEQHSADIRGRVLEIGDAAYTTRFGGGRVTRSDVLNAKPGNSKATIVADLASGIGIELASYDCVILTQTLPFIYDVHGVIRTLHRILKRGGVVLATVPGISQISRHDMVEWGDFWRFTSLSAKRLFEEVFSAENVCVRAYGNVLAATAFLHGVVAAEMTRPELDFFDRDFEVTITIRASNPL